MSEDTTATNSETLNAAASPTETVIASHATDETSGATSPEDLAKQLADLKAALKKANAESASHRHKAKELDDLKAQLEREKLTETERLQKQYNDLKTQHDEFVQAQTEQMIRHNVSLEAARQGVDPKVLDRVARFLDWEEIDVDESGKPTNIRELVEQLLADMPGLKSKNAPAQTSGGATNPPRSTTSAPPDITEEYIAKLTPGVYNSLPEDQKRRISEYRAQHSFRYGRKSL
jgi:hypothetical protein